MQSSMDSSDKSKKARGCAGAVVTTAAAARSASSAKTTAVKRPMTAISLPTHRLPFKKRRSRFHQSTTSGKGWWNDELHLTILQRQVASCWLPARGKLQVSELPGRAPPCSGPYLFALRFGESGDESHPIMTKAPPRRKKIRLVDSDKAHRGSTNRGVYAASSKTIVTDKCSKIDVAMDVEDDEIESLTAISAPKLASTKSTASVTPSPYDALTSMSTTPTKLLPDFQQKPQFYPNGSQLDPGHAPTMTWKTHVPNNPDATSRAMGEQQQEQQSRNRFDPTTNREPTLVVPTAMRAFGAGLNSSNSSGSSTESDFPMPSFSPVQSKKAVVMAHPNYVHNPSAYRPPGLSLPAASWTPPPAWYFAFPSHASHPGASMAYTGSSLQRHSGGVRGANSRSLPNTAKPPQYHPVQQKRP